MLTLFYDGACPLCMREMNSLKKHDTEGKIHFVDLRTPEYLQYPQVDYQDAMTVLHAIDADGRVLRGLDVTAAAWKAVGKHWWVQILRWPLIRAVADVFYLLFARNRYSISWMLTGKARSEEQECLQCQVKPSSSMHSNEKD